MDKKRERRGDCVCARGEGMGLEDVLHYFATQFLPSL